VDSPDAAADPAPLVASDDVDDPDSPAAPDPLATLDDLDDRVLDDRDLDDLDLDAVERDLVGVELALERLDAGTYRTDEIDGRPIPDEVLERDPIARRAP
jgi:RNA polymerase-binding transcription factor DksA